MTIEEIQLTIQTVAENQAQFSARQAKLEETIQDVAQLHQQVLRNHENRQASLEASFRKVALAVEQLTQLATVTDERLDAGDEAQTRTDGRLDALIDAQIGFDERLAQLTAVQAEHRREAEERGARLDEKLARLAEAQAKTEERINELYNRNGQKP